MEKLEELAKAARSRSPPKKLTAQAEARPQGEDRARQAREQGAFTRRGVQGRGAVACSSSAASTRTRTATGQTGTYATAWVVAADGVLVTNWHVFEDLKTAKCSARPTTRATSTPSPTSWAATRLADVAVVPHRREGSHARCRSPTTHAEVGSWVGVLGHPGDNFYVFTQGYVTRYSTNKNDDGKREKWMGMTAEYAGGSSGSPILNKYGAVVGMAALTLTIGDSRS